MQRPALFPSLLNYARQSLAVLLTIVFFALLSSCNVSFYRDKDPGKSITTQTDLGVWLVTYLIKSGRLDYAVIAGPGLKGQELPGCVTLSTDGSAIFNHPDGTKKSLIGSGLLIQVSGTTVLKSTQNISGSDFQAFLDNKPKDYSLEALIAFLHRRSENSK
ncbi:MAG: hypothetical protein NTZ46_09550 [Verrucomicrobia bacterium]|nr:hypothetical protein [Verrucomicrobiota bacterium]